MPEHASSSVCNACGVLLAPTHTELTTSRTDIATRLTHCPQCGASVTTLGAGQSAIRQALRVMVAVIATFAIWMGLMFGAIKAGLPKHLVLAFGSFGICAYLAVRRPSWFWEDWRIRGMRRVIGATGVSLLYLAAGAFLAWAMWHGH